MFLCTWHHCDQRQAHVLALLHVGANKAFPLLRVELATQRLNNKEKPNGLQFPALVPILCLTCPLVTWRSMGALVSLAACAHRLTQPDPTTATGHGPLQYFHPTLRVHNGPVCKRLACDHWCIHLLSNQGSFVWLV